MLADKLRAATAAKPLPTFVSSSINRAAAATTNTVTAPSGIQNGDLLVALGWNETGNTSVTPPTGFNLLSWDNMGGNNTQFVATKVASSESGSYAFTYSATSSHTIAVLVYRNATRVNTIGTVQKNSSVPTSVAPSITPTFGGVLVGCFGIDKTATVSNAPSGMTQRALHTASVPSFAVYDLSPQLATPSGTKSITWSASGNTASFLLQITNEPTVAPEFVGSASTQNTATGATLVINKPAGTVEGDLMVAVMGSGGGTSWTGDTGWNEISDQGSTPSLSIAYKVAGATEPSSYTFTVDSSKVLSGTILTYRYAAYDTIGSLTTATNPLILPSISPADSQSILFAVGMRQADSITLGTPTSMTAKVTDNDATSPSYIICDQTVPKGPTGTRSMSTGSTTSVAGIMLSIKPTRALT